MNTAFSQVQNCMKHLPSPVKRKIRMLIVLVYSYGLHKRAGWCWVDAQNEGDDWQSKGHYTKQKHGDRQLKKRPASGMYLKWSVCVTRVTFLSESTFTLVTQLRCVVGSSQRSQWIYQKPEERGYRAWAQYTTCMFGNCVTYKRAFLKLQTSHQLGLNVQKIKYEKYMFMLFLFAIL